MITFAAAMIVLITGVALRFDLENKWKIPLSVVFFISTAVTVIALVCRFFTHKP